MALAFRAHQHWHCDLAGSSCNWQLILMPDLCMNGVTDNEAVQLVDCPAFQMV